jgi:hypothetical protein
MESTKQQQTPKPSLKLSLKKETLRKLSTDELTFLDGVVGGTGGGTGETYSIACEVNHL